jgi:hypothetical protein
MSKFEAEIEIINLRLAISLMEYLNLSLVKFVHKKRTELIK